MIEEKIKTVLDYMIKHSTPEKPIWNVEAIKFNKEPKWNYVDGCMLLAFMALNQENPSLGYQKIVETYLNYFIDEKGSILGYEPQLAMLDDLCEARLLFDFIHIPKMEKALKKFYQHIVIQPRTYEGSFWHKRIYPNQVWLDGLFMALPFYARYIKTFELDPVLYLDIIHQFEIAEKRLFDHKKQLYVHGYDASKMSFWCDKSTGKSSHFWLRAMGWFAVGLIDCIELIPNTISQRDHVLKPQFERMISGILQYLDTDKNMFYQVVDQKGREKNYLETSGSALIAYAIMKGTRLKVLDAKYGEIGRKIFDGIVSHSLDLSENHIGLHNICLVAGLGPEDNKRRDGSYEYYVSEPIVSNDAKGLGPFVLAFAETIKK
jgi:unsaturated rhamnogalacturonyl hydrolase